MSRPPGDTGVEKTTVTVDKDFAHFLSVWGNSLCVSNLFWERVIMALVLYIVVLFGEGLGGFGYEMNVCVGMAPVAKGSFYIFIYGRGERGGGKCVPLCEVGAGLVRFELQG